MTTAYSIWRMDYITANMYECFIVRFWNPFFHLLKRCLNLKLSKNISMGIKVQGIFKNFNSYLAISFPEVWSFAFCTSLQLSFRLYPLDRNNKISKNIYLLHTEKKYRWHYQYNMNINYNNIYSKTTKQKNCDWIVPNLDQAIKRKNYVSGNRKWWYEG